MAMTPRSAIASPNGTSAADDEDDDDGTELPSSDVIIPKGVARAALAPAAACAASVLESVPVSLRSSSSTITEAGGTADGGGVRSVIVAGLLWLSYSSHTGARLGPPLCARVRFHSSGARLAVNFDFTFFDFVIAVEFVARRTLRSLP